MDRPLAGFRWSCQLFGAEAGGKFLNSFDGRPQYKVGFLIAEILRIRIRAGHGSSVHLRSMVVTIDDWEPLAKERLPQMVFEYLSGGAGEEITLRENRAGFDRIRLRPSMLVDVSQIDTTTTLFGQ